MQPTLQQYEQFIDAVWVSYSTAKDDRRQVTQDILSLEAGYARKAKLEADKSLDELYEEAMQMDKLIDLMWARLQDDEAREREEKMKTRKTTQENYLWWMIVIICLWALAMCAFSGCNTIGGFGQDLQGWSERGGKR